MLDSRALKRKMPSMSLIERHHGALPATCLRCRRIARCEKAHVITRAFFPEGTTADVTDAVSNVVPLCVACHKVQPIFVPGEEALAWAWLRFDAKAYVEHFRPGIFERLPDVTLAEYELALPSLIASKLYEWADELGLPDSAIMDASTPTRI